MHRASFVALTVSLALAALAACAEDDLSPLLHRHWFEARTAHFNVYSCGDTQQVSKLIGRLEQFRQAYSLLAGAQAVASVPIVVLAFPDAASMRPFRPLRDGKPANLTAFFHHGSDENLIVLPLIESISLQAIFHEYAHLLLRHNDPFWPLWLKEGMAEIYGTFEIGGAHTLRLGRPLPEQAFTNAFRTTLSVIEHELRRYLTHGKFDDLTLTVADDLTAPRPLTIRALAPVEVCFRLGDELLSIDRLDAAEAYFLRADKIAPR